MFVVRLEEPAGLNSSEQPVLFCVASVSETRGWEISSCLMQKDFVLLQLGAPQGFRCKDFEHYPKPTQGRAHQCVILSRGSHPRGTALHQPLAAA